MLARKLKYYGYRIAPRPAAALLQRYLQRRARRRRGKRIRSRRARCRSTSMDAGRGRSREAIGRGIRDLERLVDLAFSGTAGIVPNQNRGEILGLLGILRDVQPRAPVRDRQRQRRDVVPALAHRAPECPHLLSSTLNNDVTRAESFRLLMQPDQQLTCVQGDSHREEVFQKFREWIG